MYTGSTLAVYGSFSVGYRMLAQFWTALLRRGWELVDSSLWYSRSVLSPLASTGTELLPTPNSAQQGVFLGLDYWLNKIWECCIVSDPRDIVLAFRACFPESIRCQIVVDYSKSLTEVLTDLTRLIIENIGKLDVIFSFRHEAFNCSIKPSWVIGHKIGKQGPNGCLPDENTSGSLPLWFHFKDGGKTLYIKGVSLGTVFHVNTPLSSNETGTTFDYSTWALLEEARLPILNSYFQNTYRNLGPLNSKEAINNFFRAFLLELDFSLEYKCEHEYIVTSGNWINRIDLIELFKTADIEPLEVGKVYIIWRMFSFKCIPNLLPDPEGILEPLFGIGQEEMLPGDKICAIQGCSFPAILRNVEEGQYAVVGACWIPGFMKGEAVKGIIEGTAEAEYFDLN
jgi:hypothetical protein